MDRGRVLDSRQLSQPGFENGPLPRVIYQNVQNIKFVISPQNSAMGGITEMVAMPDPRFIDLAFNIFTQDEKDEFLRELLQAAITSVQTGSIESIRRVLLAWEYTALWKKEPEMLEEITEETSTESGKDWREFLASEGV